jgi:hypothetical protein
LSAEKARTYVRIFHKPSDGKKRTVVRIAILNPMNAAEPDKQAVCARCGKVIDPADHFEVSQPDGENKASICRSEHIVAWVMRGAEWQFARPWEVDKQDRAARGAVRVTRVRAGQEIVRDFASPEELRKWASAGAFWSGD